MIYTVANKKAKLLIHNDDIMKDELITRLSQIVDSTWLVHDCVVYSLDPLCDADIDIEKLLKFTKTLTGYEIGCNEIIMDATPDIPLKKVAEYLAEGLKRKYKDKLFNVYVLVDEDELEIRFHSIRENEGNWLVEDLDKYEKPIICCKTLK